jgi:hypothetical protein
MKIKSWNPKKEKKARFKRKLARLKKHGENVYGGYYELEEVDALSYIPFPWPVTGGDVNDRI